VFIGKGIAGKKSAILHTLESAPLLRRR